MADNTDNEYVDNPITPPSEDLQEEIIITGDTAALNLNLETNNMEVHHPHHPSHKKKWSEYLLEFFMLFLAVFLGFVAENIREDSSNKHKENGYIRSLIKDLKTDTSKIAANLNQYRPQLD